jgi:hypothetical protein
VNISLISLCRIANEYTRGPRLRPDSTRDHLIAWLEYNDRNGIYSDDDSDLAGYDRLTLESAWDLVARECSECAE